MVTTRSKNHVTTPAVVLAISMAGFVATTPEKLHTDLAREMACPKCGRLGVTCRAYERGERYRLVLSCPACRWAEEA